MALAEGSFYSSFREIILNKHKNTQMSTKNKPTKLTIFGMHEGRKCVPLKADLCSTRVMTHIWCDTTILAYTQHKCSCNLFKYTQQGGTVKVMLVQILLLLFCPFILFPSFSLPTHQSHFLFLPHPPPPPNNQSNPL